MTGLTPSQTAKLQMLQNLLSDVETLLGEPDIRALDLEWGGYNPLFPTGAVDHLRGVVAKKQNYCPVCGGDKTDHKHGTWRDDDAPYTNGCEGHVDDDATLTSGVGIGEVTYCDGSCNPKTEPAREHTGGCEWLPGGIHINRRRPGEIDD